MSECGIKSLIFSSSSTVYGDPQFLPLTEAHPTGQNIANPYGRTKFMVEEILKDLSTSDKVHGMFFQRQSCYVTLQFSHFGHRNGKYTRCDISTL